MVHDGFEIDPYALRASIQKAIRLRSSQQMPLKTDPKELDTTIIPLVLRKSYGSIINPPNHGSSAHSICSYFSVVMYDASNLLLAQNAVDELGRKGHEVAISRKAALSS